MVIGRGSMRDVVVVVVVVVVAVREGSGFSGIRGRAPFLCRHSTSAVPV